MKQGNYSALGMTVMACLLINYSCISPRSVKWVSTGQDKPWVANKNLHWSSAAVAGQDRVVLQPGKKLQSIDGFGACFNELGWTALQLLGDSARTAVMKSLFDPEEGMRFNICRMPVGANDYAREWYSLNDSAGDFAMEHFSIAHDSLALIPYIKGALALNKEMKIWGSPWCPPEWMKKNNHYACHPDVVNDLNPAGAGMEGSTQFIMEDKYLEAYALYFMKYVQSYRKAGIPIYAVHVQNEPHSCQNFPSCIWTAADLNRFIGQYLGPAFMQAELDAEIWYGTIERPSVENIDTVMTDPASSGYVKGVGFQWGGKLAIPLVHTKYPDLKLMQTESECGDGANDWKAAEYTWSLVKHYLTNGAGSYMYWNMILDETGKSHWGWKQNSLITINSATSAVTYNPEYYLMRHLSYYIGPGAARIETSGGYADVLAFENPDGSLVVLAANTGDETRNLEIVVGERSVTASLSSHTFHTFVIPG
jgi:glucosylceramidase